VALGTSWWGVSITVSDYSISSNVFAGGTVTTTDTCSISYCGGLSASSTASCSSSNSTSPFCTLYTDVGYLVAVALILALLAGVFGMLGAFGLNFGRAQLLLTILFGFVAFALLIAAVAWTAAGTGQAITNGCSTACPYGTSTMYFWGDLGAASWGAGAGWYIAVVAFILILIGAAQYASTRSQPYTARELGWTPQSISPAATGGQRTSLASVSPAPPPTPGAPMSSGLASPVGPSTDSPRSLSLGDTFPSSQLPGPSTTHFYNSPAPSTTTGVRCSQCQAMNQAGAVNCWQCGKVLTEWSY
jgi:hypothetical protein